MTDANNNNSGNGVNIPQGQPGQVLTSNGSGGVTWITIPTGNAGTWVIPGQTYTVTIGGGGGGGGGQISLPDIDLAVPVDKKKKDSDGCTCKKCKEFYQYAEPNQEDGSLICYGCRMVW